MEQEHLQRYEKALQNFKNHCHVQGDSLFLCTQADISELAIPKGISRLSEQSLVLCEKLEVLYLSQDVSDIPTEALRGCFRLHSILVSHGNKVYSSRDGALYTNNGKTLEFLPPGKLHYKVPDDVTCIGAGALEFSYFLKELHVGAAVSKFHARLYQTLPGQNMTQIVIDPGNPHFSVKNGCLLSANGKKLLRNLEFKNRDVRVPEGVLIIEPNALYCSLAESITVPEGVASIPERAFSFCIELKKVILPQSLHYIGENAFLNCPHLTDIYYNGTAAQWHSISKAAPKRITERFPIAPAGVELTDIFFGEAIPLAELEHDPIEDRWYYKSTAIDPTDMLARAKLHCKQPGEAQSTAPGAKRPTPPTRVGTGQKTANAFAYRQQTVPPSKAQEKATLAAKPSTIAERLEDLPHFEIPAGTTKIGRYDLSKCEAPCIVIPACVTEIHPLALRPLKGDVAFLISERNIHYKSVDGSLYSKDGKILLHAYLPKGAALQIPFGVTEIAPGAFSGAVAEELKLPSSIRHVGEGAFQNATIQALDLPAALKTIGKEAFAGCKQLRELTIRAESLVIAERAFADCTALDTIKLSGIKSFGEGAFAGCTALYSAQIPAIPTEPLSPFLSSGDERSPSATPCELHLCGGSISAGQWSDAEGLERLTVSGVSEIPENAFSGCTSLIEAKITDAERIGAGAFSRCTALRQLTLPRKVKEIGKKPLLGCISLEEITLPKALLPLSKKILKGAGTRKQAPQVREI